jgi:hypothetical protein
MGQQGFQPQTSGFISPGGYGQGGGMMSQPTGVGMGMGIPYQASSAFGQQMQQQLALQEQQQRQAQQQAAIHQFDPYSGLGQGWSGSSSLPNSGTPSQAPGHTRSASTSALPTDSGDEHPRQVINKYRVQLEKWDDYSWKQLLGSFDTLKGAWEKRRDEAKTRYSMASTATSQWGGLVSQEVEYWQGIVKEADSQVDTIAASKIQVQEAFSGYRHSSDSASRARVREFLNAGLQALPELPEPLPAPSSPAPTQQQFASFSTGSGFYPQQHQQQQQPQFAQPMMQPQYGQQYAQPQQQFQFQQGYYYG